MYFIIFLVVYKYVFAINLLKVEEYGRSFGLLFTIVQKGLSVSKEHRYHLQDRRVRQAKIKILERLLLYNVKLVGSIIKDGDVPSSVKKRIEVRSVYVRLEKWRLGQICTRV
jgi:hypothetical protein